MQDATRSQRCLTILCHLTGPDLLLSLWPVILQIARLVAAFARERPSPAGMFEFETQLDSLLREMGRRIVEWRLNRLEPTDRRRMPKHYIWDGEYYRLRDSSPMRNLNCLFGPITLHRFCYSPLETVGRCLFPLEVQLGITLDVATPALADIVGRLAADMTQRQVLSVLRDRHGVYWGSGTLRKVTAGVAETMGEHRHLAQVEKLLEWLRQAASQGGPRRFTLSVGRDGCMLPIVQSQKYREGAAATVSVLNGWGRRLGTVYLGQMPESGQLILTGDLTRLLEETLKRWEGPLPRLHYVTDCGHHPTEYFEQVLSKMVNPRKPDQLLEWEWVVDYYHACLYITKLAEAIFGPGRESFAWAAKQRRVLKTKPGGVFRVLRSAGALLSIRGLVGSEEAYDGAYNFLRQRACKMDYVTCRRRKLPIGSGITEAACKVLFSQRFKQSGMKWTVEGGTPILMLRTISLSRIWDNVRQNDLKSRTMPVPATPTQLPITVDQEPRKTAA